MSKINDAVKAWHRHAEGGIGLQQHLGMTWGEFAKWAFTGEVPLDSPLWEPDERDRIRH
jgi:hypothetical protein